MAESTQLQSTELVIKDTPATSQQRKDIPGLLGTSCLAQIPNFSALLHQRTVMTPGLQDPVPFGFLHIAGGYPIMIPPNSLSSGDVSGPACVPTAMVEPLSVPMSPRCVSTSK